MNQLIGSRVLVWETSGTVLGRYQRNVSAPRISNDGQNFGGIDREDGKESGNVFVACDKSGRTYPRRESVGCNWPLQLP